MGRLQVQSNGLEDQGRGGREQILVSDFQRKREKESCSMVLKQYTFCAWRFGQVKPILRVFGSCVLLREETMDTECAWEVDFVVLRRVHGVAD